MNVREIMKRLLHTGFDSRLFLQKLTFIILRIQRGLNNINNSFTKCNTYHVLGLVINMGWKLNECQPPY